MKSADITTIVVALFILVGIVGAIFLMRSRLKNGKIKVGKVSAQLGAYAQEKVVLKNVDQESSSESNTVKVRSTNVHIDGVKQVSKKDNNLEIGN